MRFSIIIVIAATLSLCTVNQPMGMEQPKQILDEEAIECLEKLDVHYAIIQNYLCEEEIKIKYPSGTPVLNSEQKKLTDPESQKIKKLNELSKALISLQKNSKNDVMLNPRYISSEILETSNSNKIIGGLAFNKHGNHPIGIELNLKEKITNATKKSGSKTKREDTLLRGSTVALTQIEILDKNSAFLLEELTTPDHYLYLLEQLCNQLYAEIAHPWCGSNEITFKYVNTELLPNLKKLKFENQSKILQLNCKISTFNNHKKKPSLKEELAAQENIAKQLTCIIQSLEATNLLEDAFCKAFKGCKKERENRFIEILKNPENPYQNHFHHGSLSLTLELQKK